MTYQSRNNLLLSVRVGRRTISARHLPISRCRVTMKVSDSNADLAVAFHSCTNCVSQNAAKTFSNRKREAASTVVCCHLHHRAALTVSFSHSELPPTKGIQNEHHNPWQSRKTDCALQNCRGLDSACIVVECLQIVSDDIACWATQIM
jgi:hypothetical protein